MSERLSQRPFPPYVFVPGENPHPKKTGGHMEGEKDPVAPPLDPADPGANDFFRFAVDLYNHDYLWESHVYFEALWNSHGRTGDIADFLKALIKLGAAGLKAKLGQKASASDHFLRAIELFEGLKQETFLGFDIKGLVNDCRQERLPKLNPSWA